MVQLLLLAALQASWLPAGESGNFAKFNWWQFEAGLQTAVAGVPQRLLLLPLQAAPLSEQVPLPQTLLPRGPAIPPLFRQSSALTQAA
jgi:hypothetical protein